MTTDVVTAISGGMFRVRVTLQDEDGVQRTVVEDTRTKRGAAMARLRTGQVWTEAGRVVVCEECGDQRPEDKNCPHCGA